MIYWENGNKNGLVFFVVFLEFSFTWIFQYFPVLDAQPGWAGQRDRQDKDDRQKIPP